MMRQEHRHRTGGLRRPIAAAAIAAGLGLFGALTAAPTPAQTPGETKTFESGQFRYVVALPASCRHEEGPGTIDAVCAPDFDPEKSAVADKATALVLGVAAETLPVDGDTTPAGLQQRFGEGAFREELPEAVCGESDRARVKIENLQSVTEDMRLVLSADVVCAPVKFLRIGERRAAVRYVIAPDLRYRLVARAPAEDFSKQRAAVDAFLASFRALPAETAPRAEK
jgi:hypothetical protein